MNHQQRGKSRESFKLGRPTDNIVDAHSGADELKQDYFGRYFSAFKVTLFFQTNLDFTRSSIK